MREKRREIGREKKNKEQMFYLEEDFRDRITWWFSIGLLGSDGKM